MKRSVRFALAFGAVGLGAAGATWAWHAARRPAKLGARPPERLMGNVPLPAVSPVPASAFPPLPRGWRFGNDPADKTWSLPKGCTLRAPALFAKVEGTTRFVAPAGTLGTLLVADAQGEPPQLLGAGTFHFGSQAFDAGTPTPWLEAERPPRMAWSSSDNWLSAFTMGHDSAERLLALWRGGNVEPLALGDGLEATDLLCQGESCALLTTRASGVAGTGAELFVGSLKGPARTWTRRALEPRGVQAEVRPAGLSTLPVGQGMAATLVAGDEAIFLDVTLDITRPPETQGELHELGRLPAPRGVLLDSLATPRLLALVDASVPDEKGCSGARAELSLQRAGQRPLDLYSPAPPISGVMRPLGQGTFVAWQAPLGCGSPRQSLYGVLLDKDSQPTDAPFPIRDVVSFAVAAEGQNLDLWLQDRQGVTWLPARCSP